MRRALRLAVVAAAITALTFVLAGCAAPKATGGPEPDLRGQWQLISAHDAGGDFELANQLISLTIEGENSTGRSTCSNYTARVLGTMANLWITPMLPRAEHCGIQAQEDLEHRYFNDLAQVRYSTVTGGVLDLESPGIDLRFQRALNLSMDLVVDRTWYLEIAEADSYYSNNLAVPVYFGRDGKTGEIRLNTTVSFSRNGDVRGDTGCRIFTAHYTQNAGEVVLTEFKYQAHGACTSEDVSEDTYLVTTLQAGFTFISEEGQLVLRSPRSELQLTLID